MVAASQSRLLDLPWGEVDRDDRRFWWMLGQGLVILLLLGVAVPLIRLPEVPREELEALPPHLARIVLEPRPPPTVKPPQESQPQPQPQPAEPTESPPEAAAQRAVPKPDAVSAARVKAASSGVLQFQDLLNDMRDEAPVNSVRGAATRQGAGQAAQADRAVISARAGRTSGGIDTGALSRTAGGGAAIAGRETTRVAGGGAGAEAGGEVNAAGKGRNVRSDESIRKVMDRNKGAVYTIYNRALRRDPALQGKVTVQLVIEPDGSVSSVKLLSSELGDAELEQKLLTRIRMIDFGAARVGRTTVKYAFDFLPF